MSSVISSLSDYFTGREVGTEVSLGSYSILKVLCIPSSAKCSCSTWGQADETDMCVAVLCFIKHLAEQTVYQFPNRNCFRCRSIWSKDCRQEFLLSLVGVLFRPQSISSLCVPMSSDLLLHGRGQTLWEKQDLKMLWDL